MILDVWKLVQSVDAREPFPSNVGELWRLRDCDVLFLLLDMLQLAPERPGCRYAVIHF
jgi:hypothetical protein